MLAGVALYSCEGPAGKDGVNGQDGIDGENGENGTAVCQVCHASDQEMAIKVAQYNKSFHANGENAAYANRSGCTKCHTSQGFVDFASTGTPAASYTNPLQQNCYTCHQVHKTYTEADWTLTTKTAVVLDHHTGTDASKYTFDKGNSNLCANCHQGRTLTPALPDVGGADVTLTSGQTRWGLHHGPMANILLGNGGYEIAGTISYSTNVHAAISNGCVNCHMSTPYGTMAGGHNLGMVFDQHGTELLNITGCSPCHANGTTAEQTALRLKVTNFQASTQALLDELEAKLITAGIYSTTTELAVAGTYSANVAGAYINWLTVKEDKSLGVHNPQYTKALLQNAIESLP